MFARRLLAMLALLGLGVLWVRAVLQRLARERRLVKRLEAEPRRGLRLDELSREEQRTARELGREGWLHCSDGRCALAPDTSRRLRQRHARLAVSGLITALGLGVLLLLMLKG